MAGFRTFATGEVLTAANVNNFLMKQSVMVFADAAARTSALGAEVVEGMLTFNKDTGALEVFDGTNFVGVGGAVKEKRVDAFTGSGTFTVPAGVTYAIAHMLGGGGGVGSDVANAGGNSSVAFASGTVTALGAAGQRSSRTVDPTAGGLVSGVANSGRGASAIGPDGVSFQANIYYKAQDATIVVAGADVTPAASIEVTVGAGGSAGTNGAAGGSGYVYIEYFEEA